MAKIRCSTLIIAAGLFLTLNQAAAADPIRITSGYITIGGGQSVTDLNFLGQIFFDFSTEGFRVRGYDADRPAQRDVLAPDLFAGFTTVSLLGGTPVLAFVSSGLMFTAIPGPTATPFQASGTLSIVDRLSRSTLFNDVLSGSGMATWTFGSTPSGGRVISGVTYTFANVAETPEPASLLLIVTGLGLLAARVRSQRPSSPGE